MNAGEPEPELQDAPLAEEILLLGEVMAAAGASDDLLTQLEVDAALGLLAQPCPTQAKFSCGRSGSDYGR